MDSQILINTIIHSDAQAVPHSASDRPFKQTSMCFSYFLSTSLFPGIKTCSRFILNILCPSSEIIHFSKEPHFFQWRMWCRNEDLRAKEVHGQQRKLGEMIISYNSTVCAVDTYPWLFYMKENILGKPLSSKVKGKTNRKVQAGGKIYLLHNWFREDAEERLCCTATEAELQRTQKRTRDQERGKKNPWDPRRQPCPTREGEPARLEQER